MLFSEFAYFVCYFVILSETSGFCYFSIIQID